MLKMTFQLMLIILFSAITSCKSVSISEIEKKKVSPGRPDQPITIVYTGTLSVLKPIILRVVNFENSNKNIPFSLIRLPDGLVLSASALLEKGDYYLSASVKFDEKLISSEDTLLFTFKDSSDNTTILKRKAILANNLLKK